MENGTIVWVAPLLTSGGGPVVVLAEDDLEQWTGFDGPDYENACAHGDAAGGWSLKDGKGFLSGGSAPSSCVGFCAGTVVLLRLVAAPSPFRLPTTMAEIGGSSISSPVLFSGHSGRYYVFDASLPGWALGQRSSVALDFNANVVVDTKRWLVDDESEYLVHLFSGATAIGGDLRAWVRAQGWVFEDELPSEKKKAWWRPI